MVALPARPDRSLGPIGRLAPIGASIVTAIAAGLDRTRSGTAGRTRARAPAPRRPSGPPGNAGAAGAGAPAGGAAAGPWGAILLCVVTPLALVLRRHRFRLVTPAPRGVVVLLQRPG